MPCSLCFPDSDLGATLALPSAIQADVIDYDEYLTGSRQEGWYIGIWSVVKKFSAAIGVGCRTDDTRNGWLRTG